MFEEWMELMDELEEQLNQIFCGSNANNVLFNNKYSSMKYLDAFHWAERKAGELRSAGIVEQEQIAVIGQNCPETLLWTIAIGMNRCSTMLINPDTDQATIQLILGRLGINHVILNNQIQSRDDSNVKKETDLGELDRPFISILSSGTTGIGKIINHSFRSIFGGAKSFSSQWRLDGNSRLYHNWPMSYMAGYFNLFLCPISGGSEIVIGEQYSNKNVFSLYEDLKQSHCTDAVLSPTMSQSLIRRRRNEKRSDLESTRIVSTSSVLYPTVAKEFHRIFGVDMLPCYGITEYGGSFTLGGSSIERELCVGRAIPEVNISERDGELYVKSPFVAPSIIIGLGKEVYQSETNFYRTDDLGSVDNEGQVYLTGRQSENIKKGGEFISLIHIEDIALQVLDVDDVIAVPIRSDFWGEDYLLKVVRPTKSKEDANNDTVSMFEELIKHLPRKNLPSEIQFVEKIQRTASGKPLRRYYLEG
jgi:acyl-CoA synthetase (AMP-forming)/AMP-acid ligase II